LWASAQHMSLDGVDSVERTFVEHTSSSQEVRRLLRAASVEKHCHDMPICLAHAIKY